jgi:hypothetical protein
VASGGVARHAISTGFPAAGGSHYTAVASLFARRGRGLQSIEEAIQEEEIWGREQRSISLPV